MEYTRGRHIRIRDNTGKLVSITGKSPSDHRALKNLKATIRRWERNQKLHALNVSSIPCENV